MISISGTSPTFTFLASLIRNPSERYILFASYCTVAEADRSKGINLAIRQICLSDQVDYEGKEIGQILDGLVYFR